MASSSTSNTDTTCSHPDEEDAVVEQLSQHLSDLNTKCCDHLSQQLKEVFAATVPDFPRLEQPEALLQRLENSYMRNVDIVEVYAARNIFTLDNLPPNRRARIAQLFFEEMSKTNDDSEIALELKEEPEHNQTNNESRANTMIDMDKLTSAPPPTQEEVERKRRAVQALEKKLSAARQRKAFLERRVQELQVAQQMTAWPKDLIAANQVQESVSALMMGVHGVEDCQEQGEDALQQVKKRSLESEDDDDTDRLAWDPLSPQPQNVEELYQKERKRINATTEDLQHVHQMLVKNKKKTSGK